MNKLEKALHICITSALIVNIGDAGLSVCSTTSLPQLLFLPCIYRPKIIKSLEENNKIEANYIPGVMKVFRPDRHTQ